MLVIPWKWEVGFRSWVPKMYTDLTYYPLTKRWFHGHGEDGYLEVTDTDILSITPDSYAHVQKLKKVIREKAVIKEGKDLPRQKYIRKIVSAFTVSDKDNKAWVVYLGHWKGFFSRKEDVYGVWKNEKMGDIYTHCINGHFDSLSKPNFLWTGDTVMHVERWSLWAGTPDAESGRRGTFHTRFATYGVPPNPRFRQEYITEVTGSIVFKKRYGCIMRYLFEIKRGRFDPAYYYKIRKECLWHPDPNLIGPCSDRYSDMFDILMPHMGPLETNKRFEVKEKLKVLLKPLVNH